MPLPLPVASTHRLYWSSERHPIPACRVDSQCHTQATELQSYALWILPDHCGQGPDGYSAKFRKIVRLVNHVQERSNNEKTIIFLQFTATLRLILMSFKSRGVGGSILSGRCAVKADKCCNVRSQPDRMQQCDLSGPVVEPCSRRLSCVFVDSALCTGLAFFQDQALGRAHRIGQKKPVNIWKLTIDDAVERQILTVCVL